MSEFDIVTQQTHHTPVKLAGTAAWTAARRRHPATQADVRGWLVVAEDGHRIGRVHDVIGDGHTLRVRYVEVRLDPHFVSVTGGERLLLPIEAVRLSARRPHVNLRGVSSAELAHAPRLGTLPLSDEDERLLRCFYRCADTGIEAGRVARGDADLRAPASLAD